MKRRKVFLIGLIVYLLGFVVLTQANSMADNWAGILAPFMIVGGVIIMVVGLLRIKK